MSAPADVGLRDWQKNRGQHIDPVLHRDDRQRGIGNVGERDHALKLGHLAHALPDVGIDVAGVENADSNPMFSSVERHRAGKPV